ncbi:hypothetical protein B0H13DRAFT_2105848 [Mycena leptocephala]|nr:hypothetical protein B0H13DRAFT_2105848 [Mycena leptocephala]
MPLLPLELEREILELTTRAAPDDRALRCRLMLIARRTRIGRGLQSCRIEPIIHEMKIFLTPRDVDRFLDLLKTKTPATDSIGHPAVSNTSDVCRVLTVCAGTRRLACWINFAQDDPIRGLIAQLPLHRLSIELEHFMWLLERYPDDPWLRNLTHLDLAFWETSVQLPDLTRLSCLTHVALRVGLEPPDSFFPAITAVRSTCPLLQVLIIPMMSDIVERDPRVVVLPFPDPVLEWKKSWWNGQPDMWTVGEAIISERRSLET